MAKVLCKLPNWAKIGLYIVAGAIIFYLVHELVAHQVLDIPMLGALLS